MNRDIDYVIAIAECGSISKAADVLHISQPSLSRYVSKLESELGLQLFVRKPDGIMLTDAGELYVGHAKEIRGLEKTLERELYHMKEMAHVHRIRVCMALNAGSLSTWEVMEKFKGRYPDCQLEFLQVMSRDIGRFLEEGRCDLGLGPDVCDHTHYDWQLLGQERLILVTPQRCSLDSVAKKREDFPFPWVDLKALDLGKIDFIMQDKSTNMRLCAEQVMKAVGVEITPKLEVTGSLLAIQAVEKQRGCAFISESFFSYVAQPERLNFYCVGPEDFYTSGGIIFDKGRKLSQEEKYLISQLKRMLRTGILRERERILKSLPTK